MTKIILINNHSGNEMEKTLTFINILNCEIQLGSYTERVNIIKDEEKIICQYLNPEKIPQYIKDWIENIAFEINQTLIKRFYISFNKEDMKITPKGLKHIRLQDIASIHGKFMF